MFRMLQEFGVPISRAARVWQVLPGEYVQLGKQGSPRQGLVKPPPDLPPNSELLAPRSFRHAPCLGFLSKNPCTQGFHEVP